MPATRSPKNEPYNINTNHGCLKKSLRFYSLDMRALQDRAIKNLDIPHHISTFFPDHKYKTQFHLKIDKQINLRIKFSDLQPSGAHCVTKHFSLPMHQLYMSVSKAVRPHFLNSLRHYFSLPTNPVPNEQHGAELFTFLAYDLARTNKELTIESFLKALTQIYEDSLRNTP